jgi:hypothetical protein
VVFIGLDLGQKRDHSAIAVVEREEKRLAWMPSMPECMRIRYLQRIPLGTPYTKVVEQVSEIVRHPMLEGAEPASGRCYWRGGSCGGLVEGSTSAVFIDAGDDHFGRPGAQARGSLACA